MSNANLKPFSVSLKEDDDHAAEQADNAYPNGDIIHTQTISEGDYAYWRK